MANNTTKNQIATKNVAEKVLARVTAMQKNEGLVIPSDYSPANALNAAYLKLQEVKDKKGKPALTACTQASISMALLDMVIQGLSPAKNQCYFVPYGNQLTLMRSYMGTVAAAKRFGNIKDVFAQVVYEGDLFKYEIIPATGGKIVRKHDQELANVKKDKIVAAYATVITNDGETLQEIMTWEEVVAAWNMGSGQSKAHKQFPQEMAKKTVINRICKMVINTSSDDPILSDAYNRTRDNEYKKDIDKADIIDVNTEDLIAEADTGFVEEPKEEPKQEPAEEPEEREEAAEEQQEEPFSDEEKAAIEAAEIAEAEVENGK